MMVIDIDYFKSINDNFGHLFGDKILLAIADVLRSIFDENDIIMRIGGDEFSVLVKDSSYAEIEAKASRVVETVREMMIDGKNYSVTCSVGVCYLAGYIPHYNFNKLLRNADVALYRAKMREETGSPFVTASADSEIRQMAKSS